jgi:hypothetical protein
MVTFELNPNYPDPEWPLPQYKYYKSHIIKNTAGIYISAKMDFPFLFFLGLDLSLYTVLNQQQSVLGFDICVNLGKVGQENN